MFIAIVKDNVVTKIGEHWDLFPNTSFPPSVPTDSFMVENNAVEVKTSKLYNPETEKLSSCPPYIDGDFVYVVQVVPRLQEDVDQETLHLSYIKRQERTQKLAVCDWTQLADADLSTELRAAWLTYRQALRDVTEQPNFPKVINWPKYPGQIETL